MQKGVLKYSLTRLFHYVRKARNSKEQKVTIDEEKALIYSCVEILSNARLSSEKIMLSSTWPFVSDEMRNELLLKAKSLDKALLSKSMRIGGIKEDIINDFIIK